MIVKGVDFMGCLGIILISIGLFSFCYFFYQMIMPYSISFLPLIISIVCFIIGGIFLSVDDSNQEKKNKEIKNKFNNDFMKKMNLNTDSIKFEIQQNNNSLEYLIYTNEKRLFFVNITKEQIKELLLNEILKIDIQVTTQEKTKQEILTLTPTFHTQKTILSYHLKIITEKETIIITVAPTYNNKELLERFKLVLERDIKEITGNTLIQ